MKVEGQVVIVYPYINVTEAVKYSELLNVVQIYFAGFSNDKGVFNVLIE